MLLLGIAVPCLRRLFPDFSPRVPGSIPSKYGWELCYGKWQCLKFRVDYFECSPLSTIPPVLHARLYITEAIYKRSNWQSCYKTHLTTFRWSHMAILRTQFVYHQNRPSAIQCRAARAVRGSVQSLTDLTHPERTVWPSSKSLTDLTHPERTVWTERGCVWCLAYMRPCIRLSVRVRRVSTFWTLVTVWAPVTGGVCVCYIVTDRLQYFGFKHTWQWCR